MHFVVAHPWDERKPDDLAIYTYGGQIQHGSIKEANHFLEYVQRQEPGRKYSIYKVSFTKIK